MNSELCDRNLGTLLTGNYHYDPAQRHMRGTTENPRIPELHRDGFPRGSDRAASVTASIFAAKLVRRAMSSSVT